LPKPGPSPPLHVLESGGIPDHGFPIIIGREYRLYHPPTQCHPFPAWDRPDFHYIIQNDHLTGYVYQGMRLCVYAARRGAYFPCSVPPPTGDAHTASCPNCRGSVGIAGVYYDKYKSVCGMIVTKILVRMCKYRLRLRVSSSPGLLRVPATGAKFTCRDTSYLRIRIFVYVSSICVYIL
jgi:hypothetical protein